jgi:ferredoxin
MKLNLFLPSREQLKGRSRRGVAARLRSVLDPLGRGWARSPIRRLVQLTALATFLVLLLAIPAVQDKTFLQLDPLAGISAALSARAWMGSLVGAAIVLAACIAVPRVFCGWICPLGTLIDVVGWLFGRRARPKGLRGRRWWVHLRYYVLAAVLVAAALGVTVVGLVAAIPLLTRGLVYAVEPLRLGLFDGWDTVPPITGGQWAGTALLAAVLLTTLGGRRLWCRCLCPTGALLSLASRLRLTERKVTGDCIGCGKCIAACSFDAIGADFSTRADACTFCQDCGGACPTGAITFAGRWDSPEALPRDDTLPADVGVSRRGFLTGAAAGAATVLVTPPVLKVLGGGTGDRYPVRPPGSVPEEAFLSRCVRCGNCIEACPSNVLRPAGLALGLESLWTPHAVADWAGCLADCNRCGDACPTEAIRPLPIEEKRAAHMGRAVVDPTACLPHAALRDCGLCAATCRDAGYEAIVLVPVHEEASDDGRGFWAPQVDGDRCVGCGLCQATCYRENHLKLGDLTGSAIKVEAGPGKEDRLARGSYVALRKTKPGDSQPPTSQKVDVPYPTDLPELPDE